MGQFARGVSLLFAILAGVSMQAAPIKSCGGAEVLSVETAADSGQEFPFSPRPGRIDVKPFEPKDGIPQGETGLRVISFGPVLNSHSSREVQTEFDCTKDGLALVATITTDPSAPIKKDVQWRPKIEMTLLLHKPAVAFETRWRLRLPDGAALNRGRTPWSSEQEYPFKVKAILPSSSE
jgi:hypothetical protein